MPIVLALVGLLLLLSIWEIYICEGAHLGQGFVVWLYERSAPRYNRIKEFDRDWEIRYLGEPVAQVIGTLSQARLLDVGAGTGRLAWALAASREFTGSLVAVEPSAGMRGARLPCSPEVQVAWVQAWARALPFSDNHFDLVSSLEMLEFTPDPDRSLEELVRVLRPGGWLLITNRVGWQAPLILGRTFSRDRFPNLLREHGLAEVEVFPWQMDYDLAWARKPIW